ncbi:hypothetical protein BDP27DRAFT_1313273 [Rhodocollybia butyracea]|uniref:Uncharacterized protein n=1 Tax=Rhodocollybia butyracea TaxID=206335 RepID=A0A9P5Q766_9AGAR|nr:hypothetical protein BDP27DRAFT_1313273 [Rhodocollybia butyracea]
MSFASTLRQSVSSSSRVLRRHSSSQAQKTEAPHALSPQKMRALISLYHQSDTFITPENLSERIDVAFTGSSRDTALASPYLQAGLETLRLFYKQANAAPKFSEWDREREKIAVKKTTQGKTDWNAAQYSEREWKILEALYGVDASGHTDPLPGLEALEELEGGEIGLPPGELVVEDDSEDYTSSLRDEVPRTDP